MGDLFSHVHRVHVCTCMYVHCMYVHCMYVRLGHALEMLQAGLGMSWLMLNTTFHTVGNKRRRNGTIV